MSDMERFFLLSFLSSHYLNISKLNQYFLFHLWRSAKWNVFQDTVQVNRLSRETDHRLGFCCDGGGGFWTSGSEWIGCNVKEANENDEVEVYMDDYKTDGDGNVEMYFWVRWSWGCNGEIVNCGEGATDQKVIYLCDCVIERERSNEHYQEPIDKF